MSKDLLLNESVEARDLRIATMAAARALRIHADAHPRPTQVTQTQAAEMLGVTPRTVHNYIRSGRLKLNRCGYLPIEAVDAMRASQ